MQNRKRNFFLSPGVYFIFFALGLSACSDQDVSDLGNEIAAIKARPKQQIEPLPEMKVIQPFIFTPEGLRDPFKAVEASAENNDVSAGGLRPDASRVKEELENFSLDSLRMVGTVDLKQRLWALIKASDGTIHRVQQGNYMGKSDGKIVHIDVQRIELVELVPDKPGTWRERPTTVVLAE